MHLPILCEVWNEIICTSDQFLLISKTFHTFFESKPRGLNEMQHLRLSGNNTLDNIFCKYECP